MHRTAILLLAAGLAACTSPTGNKTEAASAEAAAAINCDATQARFAIGQLATPELQEDARNKAGASTVRLLRPDQVVTMEYNGERLNLRVNAQDIVQQVNCG